MLSSSILHLDCIQQPSATLTYDYIDRNIQKSTSIYSFAAGDMLLTLLLILHPTLPVQCCSSLHLCALCCNRSSCTKLSPMGSYDIVQQLLQVYTCSDPWTCQEGMQPSQHKGSVASQPVCCDHRWWQQGQFLWPGFGSMPSLPRQQRLLSSWSRGTWPMLLS